MASLQNVVNNIKSKGLQVAEYFTPVLKESKFRETGVITPEEFVAAGDHLVHHCPSWQWAAGDAEGAKDYLPKDKQFLITRNVPCYKRCSQVMECGADLEESQEEDGWVAAAASRDDASAAAEKVAEMSLGEEKKKPVAQPPVAEDEESDQEAVDMDDFIEGGMDEEDDAGTLDVKKAAEAAGGDDPEDAGGEIVATRTYDLNITYDKYYQTPRLFLFGHDENKKALTVDQMYEDFSSDHANKTITMEAHPHLPGPPQASVHPCRHAQTMKKLVDQMTEGGGELGVHMYLLVFLKFMQAIIPTVEYDFTRTIALQ